MCSCHAINVVAGVEMMRPVVQELDPRDSG
jgi:hypothetical protein